MQILSSAPQHRKAKASYQDEDNRQYNEDRLLAHSIVVPFLHTVTQPNCYVSKS